MKRFTMCLLVGAVLLAGTFTAPSAQALGNQANLIGESVDAPWEGANTTMYAGDSISYLIRYKGNVDFIDRKTSPRVRTTDGKPGDVIRLVASWPRPVTIENFSSDEPIVELYRWRTLRPGSAVIEFVDQEGTVVGSIAVTVKPDDQ